MLKEVLHFRNITKESISNRNKFKQLSDSMKIRFKYSQNICVFLNNFLFFYFLINIIFPNIIYLFKFKKKL